MFKKISEGDIYSIKEMDRVAAGSRTAVLPDGRLACTFNIQTKIGSNDFAPMISYSDDGEEWSAAEYLWPEFIGKKSIFASLRKTLDGRVCIAGFCTPIKVAGESFWSDEIGGMLENKLFFSISEDGYHFPPFTEVELPYYGSAENPGGMLVDRDGTIYLLYSPYRAIEMREDTDTCQMVLMKSTDGGKTFTASTVAKAEPPCQYGEAWVIRLSDNAHMISTWQTARIEGSDQYLLSYDGAKSFSGPYLMPFNGQTTALEAYDDGQVLVIYNQRKEQPAGVWLALAKPDLDGFHMMANECIWEASKTTSHQSGGEFNEWTDFAFGEPQVTVLPSGELLACLWYDEGKRAGIRFVKLQIEKENT